MFHLTIPWHGLILCQLQAFFAIHSFCDPCKSPFFTIFFFNLLPLRESRGYSHVWAAKNHLPKQNMWTKFQPGPACVVHVVMDCIPVVHTNRWKSFQIFSQLSLPITFFHHCWFEFFIQSNWHWHCCTVHGLWQALHTRSSHIHHNNIINSSIVDVATQLSW